MKGMYAQSPEAMQIDQGQAEAAISAQLTAVKFSEWGIGGAMYDKIVQVLLYVVVVLMPLFYLPWTSSYIEYNKQLLLIGVSSIGLVVWLLGAVISGKLTIRTSLIDKGVLGLLVSSIIATVFSLTPLKSLFGVGTSLSSSLLSVVGLSLFYFLCVNALHDRGRMLRSALVASLSITLLLGLFQMVSFNVLPGSFTNSRAFNTVGSINALGVLAAVALSLFAKTIYRNANRYMLGVAIAGVTFAVIILGILNWWVLWVVALGGMLAMIAFDSLNATQLSNDYGSRKNRFAMSRFVVPMLVVVLGAFLLLVKFDLKSVKGQFPVEVAPSYGLSLSVAADALKHKPLFGWGPENFSIAFDRYGAGSLANTQFANAQFFDGANEIVNVLAQQGVVGLLAIGFLLWCLVQVFMRFGTAISDSVARGEGASLAVQSTGTLAALIAMIVTLFIYPMNITLWFVFFVLMALASLVISGDESRTVDIEERPMYSLAASLGFIVALILVLSGLYFTSVRYFGDVKFALAKSQETPAKSMEMLSAAINLNASSDRYVREASQVALSLLREEVAKKEGGDEQSQRIQNLMGSSIQLAQKAAAISPEESLNWSNLGQVYQSMTGIVDDVEKLSEDAFKKAGELRPGDPSFDNAIGQMWLARSDLIRQVVSKATGANAETLKQQQKDSLVNAEAAFDRAIEKSPQYGLAIYNRAAVKDRQNNVKGAIEDLEKIAPSNSNQPTLMFEIGLLYIRDGQKEKAIAALQRAVLLAPQYANARWYLALLLEEKNDIAGALAQLNEVAKGNSDNAELQAKITSLEAGQRQIPPNKVIETKPLQ